MHSKNQSMAILSKNQISSHRDIKTWAHKNVTDQIDSVHKKLSIYVTANDMRQVKLSIVNLTTDFNQLKDDMADLRFNFKKLQDYAPTSGGANSFQAEE